MKDQLDKKLKEWASKAEPSKDHLDKLSALIHNEFLQGHTFAADQFQYPRKKGYIFVMVAAAVAVFVALLYFSFIHINADNEANAVAVAKISSDRFNETADLVREMNSLFGENWRWIVESGNEVDIGIKPLYGGTSANAKPMFVRITLVAKKLYDKRWDELWHSEVVMRSGECVEISTGPSDDSSLAFWVLPLSNGILHVESSVALTSPLPVISSESIIVEDGTPTEIASFSKGKTCYKLYQTIKLLPLKKKESA